MGHRKTQTAAKTWFSLAILFLIGAASGGCQSSASGPSGSAYWDYSWDGEVTNLTGCPEGERFLHGIFITPVWDLLRRDDHVVVIAFQVDGPSTALIFEVKSPEGKSAAGALDTQASTRQGTLRAWLVRMPAEMFEKSSRNEYKYNVFNVIDRQRLLAIVDGNASGGDAPGRGLVYPMTGWTRLSADPQHVRSVRVELETADPLPVYTAYAEMTVALLDESRGYARPKSVDDREIRAWRQCLGHPSAKAPAVVKGAFTGAMVRPPARLDPL